MRISYLSSILILAVYKLSRILYSEFISVEESVPSLITAPVPISVVEQQFALGNKVPISSVDLYDLGLIPGVGDKLGLNILESREKIIFAAKQNDLTNKRMNPFELAHGVGEKTAIKLGFYLEPK